MASARPAAEIDPVSLISSSRRTLPGPIERSPPKSMRRRSDVLAAVLLSGCFAVPRPIAPLCDGTGFCTRDLSSGCTQPITALVFRRAHPRPHVAIFAAVRLLTGLPPTVGSDTIAISYWIYRLNLGP